MKQIVIDRGAVHCAEAPLPVLGERTIEVAVAYSWISSGTERATVSAAQRSLIHVARDNVQRVIDTARTEGFGVARALVQQKISGTVQSIGYAVSGRVVAVGAHVAGFSVGDLVACGGSEHAFHAERVVVPEFLCAHVSDEKFLKAASVASIGAIALHGVRQAEVSLGETVIVVGLGLIGLTTVQLLKIAGCRVIAVDPIAERREKAQLFGADYTLALVSDSVDILFVTEHRGADCTIITAATSDTTLLQHACAATRRRGKIVVVGDIPITCERAPFYTKELTLTMACSYGPGRYDQRYEKLAIDYPFEFVRWTEQRNIQTIVNLIEREQLKIDQLCEREYTPENASSAYTDLAAGTFLGAVFRYSSSTSKEPEKKISVARTVQMPLRTALIGAGGFARTRLAPFIQNNQHLSFAAVCDADWTRAQTVGRTYGATIIEQDFAKIIERDDIDCCVIATYHKDHAAQAIAALKAGKAVFLEKPLATTLEQLHEFSNVLQTLDDVRFCVDFNRLYAPSITEIRKFLAQRSSPLAINYRVNAGYIPLTHWTQQEEGGGRIIGELCHMVNLIDSLVGTEPISVSVTPVISGREDIVSTDNVSVQLAFADGSVASLLYTALGNTKANKETLELFWDGKTIVLDDFCTARGYGISLEYTARMAQKGHEELFTLFCKRLSDAMFVPPIAYGQLLRTTRLTLLINELTLRGGGFFNLR